MFLHGPVDGDVMDEIGFAADPAPRALVPIEAGAGGQGPGHVGSLPGGMDDEEGPALRPGFAGLRQVSGSDEAIDAAASRVGVASEVLLYEVAVGHGPVDGNVHERAVQAVLEGARLRIARLAAGTPARRPDSRVAGSSRDIAPVPAGAHRDGPSATAATCSRTGCGCSTARSAGARSGSGERLGVCPGSLAVSWSCSISLMSGRARSRR